MDEIIEKFAIECARGNNGGEWATHYNEEQKNFWRDFVRHLIDATHADMARKIDELDREADGLYRDAIDGIRR